MTFLILFPGWKPDSVCIKERSEEKVMQILIPLITNYVSGAVSE